MNTPNVIRINHLINLMTALLKEFSDKGQQVDKKLYEMFFVYSFAWSIGGLFENEEREKFHRDFLEKKNAAILPQISAQKMTVDKETIFDYYVDPNTK